MRRAEDQRVAEVHRDSLQGLIRKVVVIGIGLGVPVIVAMILLRADEDPVIRWGYPPAAVFLLAYGWVLLRRPQHAITMSRVTLALFQAAWVVGLVVQLRTADDVTAGWHALFPTTFTGLQVFVVVGFLYFPTRAALVNALCLIGTAAVAGSVALSTRPGGSAHVLDLVRFCIGLVVVAALLLALSRAKARLGVALADVRRAEAQVSQMRDMAYRDPLTGIANRRRLVEELGFQANRVSVARPVAVVFFDLDRFKAVNDEHGHAVGDDVLRTVARLAVDEVRAEDIVARLGGEEFVVVAPGIDERCGVELAERLRARLASDVERALGVRVTASFGVVALRAAESPVDVLRRVDAQMYVAKRAGRDQVTPLS